MHTNRLSVHTKLVRTLTETASFPQSERPRSHEPGWKNVPVSRMSGFVWTRPAWVLFLICPSWTCLYKKQRAFFSPLKVSSSNWTVSSAADVMQVLASFGVVMGLLFMLERFQSDVMLFWCLQLLIFFSADVIKRNAPRTLSHQIKRGRGTTYLCGLAGTSGTVLFWGGRGVGGAGGIWQVAPAELDDPHISLEFFRVPPPLPLVSQINWDAPPSTQKKRRKMEND